MDIVKGSLDEISRPASISKSRSGSRASTASSSEKPKLNLAALSLEVLPPEPGLSKVSSSISENIWSSAESSFSSSCDEMDVSFKSSVSGSRRETSPLQPTEGKETDRGRRGTPSLQPTEGKETDHGRRGTPSLQPTEGKETRHDRRGTPPLQPSENIVNYEDHTTASPNQHSEMRSTSKQTVNSKEASDAKPHEASDEENTDPELAGAIRKMKMLDKILAKKQVREKEVKYQGQQMRKKLWEELQSAMSPEAPPTHEETLNTRKFLALTPQARDVTDADSLEEEVIFTPVFHTQIPAEDGDWPRAPNNLDSHPRNDLSDVSNDGDKISSIPRKRSRVKMNKRDFIKRNIELARDAGHPVVLMDDEKQRIEDLLKDDEEDSMHPEALVEVSRWIVPGEGYTPEPEEHKLLAKIDAELQAVFSAKDFASIISSSCTSIETQSNQDSFSPMNGDEEAELFESAEDVLPGELVLRLTKEERLQQARLRDIDHELEALGRSLNTPVA
ncbi:fibrous sheath-interacting protein 1-like isoform X2 [Lissotriton helveticus]